PFLDVAVVLDPALDLLQRELPALERRELALERLRLVERGLVPGVERRARRLELREQRLLARELAAARFELLRELLHQRGVGRGELVALGREPGGAGLECLDRLVGVGEVRLLQVARLLGLGETLALGVEARLRVAEHALGLGHRRLIARETGLRLREDVARVGELRLPVGDRLARLGLLAPARRGLRELRFEALTRLGDEPDLGLETRDLGVGAVQLALRRVQRVAGAVVVGSRLLGLALGVAQARRLGLELDRAALDVAGVARDLGLRVVAADQPQQALLVRALGRELVELARDLGLLRELLDLRAELGADVADARQVLARVGEPVLGLAPPLLVLRDPRRLLEEHPQLLWLGLDDARDHALLDDGVGARAQPRAEEDVVHVAPAHVRAVDAVGRLAVALQRAPHRDLGVLRPLACRLAQAVVEHELDARPRDRLALRRAVEDHVLHRVAAQRRRARLAEHPAHRVHDVRLAAAVGADDADELAGDADGGRIDERLEARELDLSEAHLLPFLAPALSNSAALIIPIFLRRFRFVDAREALESA